MNRPLEQHQVEIERNRGAWESKPLLRRVYDGFYRRILSLIDPSIPGRVLEIGSGAGNLKQHLPGAILSDLFPNPWLDLACDGYDLPFRDRSLSHLILFDVFHHLEAPNAFLREARRVICPGGRLILFEPYISLCSLLVYGLLHHEPVAMREAINFSESPPQPRRYYAAQGNATRLFFKREQPGWPEGWSVFHREAFADFAYLLSGGFSKPSVYPEAMLPVMQGIDRRLSKWPRLSGARCLVGMTPETRA